MGNFCITIKKQYIETSNINDLLKLIEEEEKELAENLNQKEINDIDGYIHNSYNLIIVKSALTEISYLGYLYEKDLTEDKTEFENFKSVFTNYYSSKESNWRDSLVEHFCAKIREYKIKKAEEKDLIYEKEHEIK